MQIEARGVVFSGFDWTDEESLEARATTGGGDVSDINRYPDTLFVSLLQRASNIHDVYKSHLRDLA